MRIAPSTDFSASRLCGSARSGVAGASVSGMAGEQNIAGRGARCEVRGARREVRGARCEARGVRCEARGPFMKRLMAVVSLLLLLLPGGTPVGAQAARPRLVVFIVADQMRAD